MVHRLVGDIISIGVEPIIIILGNTHLPFSEEIYAIFHQIIILAALNCRSASSG